MGNNASRSARTLSLGPVVIRDDPAEARAVVERFKETNPKLTREVETGSADQITELCQAYAAIGFHHPPGCTRR